MLLRQRVRKLYGDIISCFSINVGIQVCLIFWTCKISLQIFYRVYPYLLRTGLADFFVEHLLQLPFVSHYFLAVLQQVHSLLQIEFSTESDLVLSLSIDGTRLVSSKSFSSLYLLSRLFVTSIIPFIFRSVTCLRRQFLHKT